jgi:5'-nucleotidase
MEAVVPPLILVTNDDGIDSSGLWASVKALLPLGDVLVVAPDRQWSGAGRSMPAGTTGQLLRADREIGGRQVSAYAVDASPALAVVHAVVELAPRRPSLAVSGINFGANLGTDVTVSGTVGAALEAGAFGIPSMAVSLEMDSAFHLSGPPAPEYSAAQTFIGLFASRLLTCALPHDVSAINVNIPSGAASDTVWRLTRLSRLRYFVPLAPERTDGQGRPGYDAGMAAEQAELDSDMRATIVDRVVSVTPLSLDITSRLSFSSMDRSASDIAQLRDREAYVPGFPGLPVPDRWPVFVAPWAHNEKGYCQV